MPRRNTVPTAHNPTAIRFGLRLRGQRLRCRLSFRHFARTLGLAPGRLSNFEGAGTITDPTAAAFMLGALGTDYLTAQRIITDPAHHGAPDLVDTDHDSHAAIAWHYEQLADRVTVWAPTLIPDLLRTPEHDLTLITHELADTGIGDAYTLALPQRRENLTNPRRHYTFLLGDTALRECTPVLRQRQIDRLRSLAEQRHITIRVVPTETCPPGLVGPFTLYAQNKTAVAVAIHHHHASTYITNPVALNGYGKCARQLSTLDAITISEAVVTITAEAATLTGQ
jgi:transcriptional regulator with XRE-family HTH domain